MSIRAKVFFVITFSFLLLASGALLFFNEFYAASMENLWQKEIKLAQLTFVNLQENSVRALSSTIDALIINDSFIDAFIARDRQRLLTLASPFFEEIKVRYGITHFYFIDPPTGNECFLRIHNPSLNGDKITRATYQKSLASSSFGAGIELGKTAFALRVVHPFYRNGALVGFMELGQEIESFFSQMKKQSGNELGLLVLKSMVSENDWAGIREKKNLRNNWNGMDKFLLIHATTSDESIVNYGGSIQDVPTDGKVLETINKDGKTYVRGVFPIYDASDKKAGLVFVIHETTNVSSLYSELRTKQNKLIGALTISVIGIAFLVIFLLNKLIFDRLGVTKKLITRFVGGDYESAITVKSKDEIGEIESLMENLRKLFRNLLAKNRG